MQEVFEKIKEFIYKEIDRTSSFIEHDTQCKILHFVEGLEEEYNNGWIPVEERLPKTNGVYEVTRKVREYDRIYQITSASYFDGQDIWHNDICINHARPYLTDVIAWKYPTEPYQPKGEKE